MESRGGANLRKHKRLVVPGRFQPPHWGHVKTIEYALNLSSEVIIVIGSAQESFTIENPLTAGERYVILDALLKELMGEEYCKRIKIIPAMDINSNKLWVQYLRMLLPPFEGVVSGNPLVLMLFKDMGLAAYKPPIHKREVCSGTSIRHRIIRGDPKWSECIPEVVRDYLIKLGFIERLRELSSGE